MHFSVKEMKDRLRVIGKELGDPGDIRLRDWGVPEIPPWTAR